jgi:chitosanase
MGPRWIAAALVAAAAIAAPVSLLLASDPAPLGAATRHLAVPSLGPASPAPPVPVPMKTVTVPPSAKPVAGRLTARQIMIMDDITAAFESSKVAPQYAAIENLEDGCGYTAGWIGFCSATGDMLDLVERYNRMRPGNVLRQYTDRLQRLADDEDDGVGSLGGAFPGDWRRAAADPVFRRAQLDVGHDSYLAPAIAMAKRHGIKTALGVEHLFDTALQSGPSATDCAGMPQTVSRTNSAVGGNPASGVSEKSWLAAYNQIRIRQLKNPCNPDRKDEWPDSIDRVEALSELVRAGNRNLDPPVRLGSDVLLTITRPGT